MHYSEQVLDLVLNKLSEATTFPTATSTNNDEYEAFLVHVDLLNFLQDRWSYLLLRGNSGTAMVDSLNRTLQTLMKLFVSSGTDSVSAAAIHFRCVCAETLTALLINVDAFRHEPALCADVVSMFLACLLERAAPPLPSFTATADAAPTTTPKSRQLRVACCRCLLEIERNYAGILSSELQSLCNHVYTRYKCKYPPGT